MQKISSGSDSDDSSPSKVPRLSASSSSKQEPAENEMEAKSKVREEVGDDADVRVEIFESDDEG
eukprot:79932-Hanusia_phi.AAC.1